MKFSIILVLGMFFALSVHAKGRVETPADKLLAKVKAENGIFRCSFTETANSKLEGEKLKSLIRKKCKNEISGINKWYKKEAFKKRSELLMSNGIRSASSHKKTL